MWCIVTPYGRYKAETEEEAEMLREKLLENIEYPISDDVMVFEDIPIDEWDYWDPDLTVANC